MVDLVEVLVRSLDLQESIVTSANNAIINKISRYSLFIMRTSPEKNLVQHAADPPGGFIARTVSSRWLESS